MIATLFGVLERVANSSYKVSTGVQAYIFLVLVHAVRFDLDIPGIFLERARQVLCTVKADSEKFGDSEEVLRYQRLNLCTGCRDIHHVLTG